MSAAEVAELLAITTALGLGIAAVVLAVSVTARAIGDAIERRRTRALDGLTLSERTTRRLADPSRASDRGWREARP